MLLVLVGIDSAVYGLDEGHPSASLIQHSGELLHTPLFLMSKPILGPSLSPTRRNLLTDTFMHFRFQSGHSLHAMTNSPRTASVSAIERLGSYRRSDLTPVAALMIRSVPSETAYRLGYTPSLDWGLSPMKSSKAQASQYNNSFACLAMIGNQEGSNLGIQQA